MNGTRYPIEPDVTDYCQGYYHVRVNNAYQRRTAVVNLRKLADALPHGSGIDGDWSVTVCRNGDVTVYGEYHAMSESGYCGWRNFRFGIRRAVRNKYTALNPLWWCGVCDAKHYSANQPTICPHCKEEPSNGWVKHQQWQVTKVKGTDYLMAFVGGGDASDYLYDCIWQPLADDLDIHAMESGVVVNSQQQAEQYTK